MGFYLLFTAYTTRIWLIIAYILNNTKLFTDFIDPDYENDELFAPLLTSQFRFSLS